MWLKLKRDESIRRKEEEEMKRQIENQKNEEKKREVEKALEKWNV
jgi:hypothetical protein